MASITYNDIFTRFYLHVKAYDLVLLPEEQAREMQNAWLHMAASKPYVRRLFSSFSLDDEIEMVTYELKYQVDTDSDADFVTDVLALGVVLQWFEPHLLDLTSIKQIFTGQSETFYSQAAHLSELRNLKDSLLREQRGLIRDRGWANNSYLDGGE